MIDDRSPRDVRRGLVCGIGRRTSLQVQDGGKGGGAGVEKTD